MPGTIVVAAEAYDTDGIRTFLADRGARVDLPPRPTREGNFNFSRWV